MKRIVSALLVVLLFAGCVTPPVDWQARVGNYTESQAIADLGQPDKSAKLSDGTVVDEWLTSHARVIEAPEPYFLPSRSSVGADKPSYTEVDAPNYFLQLTFGADGKLKAWKKFAR